MLWSELILLENDIISLTKELKEVDENNFHDEAEYLHYKELIRKLATKIKEHENFIEDLRP